jgi:tetratricopeptide (TPR) repeat protein
MKKNHLTTTFISRAVKSILAWIWLCCSFCMYGQLPKGYIIKIDGERIYLDLHAPDVKVSDKVSVYSVGEVITHPVTKKQIRTEGETIGTIEITQVYEKYSVGRALPDATSALKEGMEIRKTEPVLRKLPVKQTPESTDEKPVNAEPVLRKLPVKQSPQQSASLTYATTAETDGNQSVRIINLTPDENHTEEDCLSETCEEHMTTKLSPQERAARLKHLRTFAQKGTKVFIQVNCWDDSKFEQVFLTEFGRRKIWEIVNRPQDADFILNVQAIPRTVSHPYVGQLALYDMYALIFDEKERLLWRSDMYFGHKIKGAVWSNLKKNACVKFVKKALRNDISKASDVYDGIPNILGISKVPTEKYELSEMFFWQGIDHFNQYNYKDAIKLFTKALKQNPHHALACKYRAIAYNHLSKYKNARNDIVTAMKLDPFNTQNDTIYADIMRGENEKNIRDMSKYGMILGIAGAMTQTLNAAMTLSSGGNIQPGASSGINTARSSAAANTGKRICTSCNGTGKNSARERPALYSYSNEDYSGPRCSICGDRSNHYHKDCPSCLGKGYR